MAWSIVGLGTSLVPWCVLVLASSGAADLPCESAETAAIKASCCLCAYVAVIGSAAGLRRRAFRFGAATGFLLGFSFLIAMAAADPAAAGAVLIPAATLGFVTTQWR
jgi:hypothetical protein